MTVTLQESIVERTRQIDNLLFKLGGNGRNMRERAWSVRAKLDAQDSRQLDRIIRVHGRMVYDSAFKIARDHRRFLSTCEWLIVRLEAQLASGATVQPWPAVRYRLQPNKIPWVNAALAASLVAMILCANLPVHAGWMHGLILTGIQFVAALTATVFFTAKIAAKRR